MSAEQAELLRENMQAEILRLLRYYQSETGLIPRSVDVLLRDERAVFSGDSKPLILAVRIEVKL